MYRLVDWDGVFLFGCILQWSNNTLVARYTLIDIFDLNQMIPILL
jgi:hypothetical protein